MDGLDPTTKARVIVANHFNESRARADIPELALSNTKLVWFSKTLKNWKALVITDVPDKLYYEVTYDGNRECTYLDVYNKLENVVIPD